MPARRQRAAAALLAMVLLAVAAPGWAQSADDLDENQQQQDELNTRLEILQADHAELEAALEATSDRVRQQEAAKREAEQRLEVARAEVRAARAAVVEMQAEIVDLGHQADEDAVDLYMNPEPTLTVMDTEDLTQATRRDALLSTIASRHSDVLDRLGGLRIDLVDAEDRSREAAAAVEAERAEVAARLADYQATLREQQRLESALADRIDAVQAEAAALAEEEAAIRAALAQASQAPVGPGGTIDTPPSAAGLVWPAQGTITGVFGEDRGDHIHAGIDIANGTNTPIYAANEGTVIGGCGGGYGNCILIDHGDGMVTLYAHQNSI
ncbi:MAG TPA: peptidoglycan DD-metalloendopeptidase family protein, partial [Acidimicrobiales bacterium]